MAKISYPIKTQSQTLLCSLAAELFASAVPIPTASTNPTAHPVENNGKIQLFVQKLWQIANSDSDIVGWTSDGSRVVVYRPKDFESQVIPLFFNHSNMSSFTRQLHNYGFTIKLSRKRSREQKWFQHNFFLRDQPELLVRITRKRCNQQMASQEEVSELRKEVQELRETVAEQKKQLQSIFMLLANVDTSDRKRKRPKQEPPMTHQFGIPFDLTRDSSASQSFPELEVDELSFSLFDSDDGPKYFD